MRDARPYHIALHDHDIRNVHIVQGINHHRFENNLVHNLHRMFLCSLVDIHIAPPENTTALRIDHSITWQWCWIYANNLLLYRINCNYISLIWSINNFNIFKNILILQKRYIFSMEHSLIANLAVIVSFVAKI